MTSGLNAQRSQMVGEPVGSLVELSIAQPALSCDESGSIGYGVDHNLEQIGQIELPGAHPLSPLYGRGCRLPTPLCSHLTAPIRRLRTPSPSTWCLPGGVLPTIGRMEARRGS